MVTTRPAPSTVLPSTESPRPFAWRAIGLIVVAKLALNAYASPRYGWHRDELYYADAGRHLAFGFVDFPPVTPLVAAAARAVGGDGLVALRAAASLAGAGVLIVVGLLCRELGGSRRAQTVAALATVPALLATNAMFQTVSFDQLTSVLLVWTVVRVLDQPSTARWIVVGAVTGVAYETKYTAVVLIAALVVGLLLTSSGRAALCGRGPWIALGTAAAIALPNLWWQVGHDWVSVDFLTGRGEVRDENPLARFVIELLLMTGLFLLALRGLRWLWRSQLWRGLAIGLALVPIAWLVAGGKSYYALPGSFCLLAAGAAAVDQLPEGWHGWRWQAVPTSLLLITLLASPLLLPVLSAERASDLGLLEVRDDYLNELGWPELVDDVAAAWEQVPPGERSGTALIATNYGVAGAIERWGADRGVPHPLSGHLTWRLWAVPAEARGARRAVVVGWSGATAPPWCGKPRQIGEVEEIPLVETEEAGFPIWWCDLAVPVEQLRAQLVSNS